MPKKPSKKALRNLYRLGYIAGAAAVGFAFGGPPGAAASAATATAELATPIGIMAIDAAVDHTSGEFDQDPRAMAMGGLITSPTLALLGEAGPELVVPLPLVAPKRTRKKTDYDKRMRRALIEVNKSARLKNGSFRKGWDQGKVMKRAHKLARKYGPSTKKGQVRKTARRAFRK